MPEEEAKELGGTMWEIVLEAFQESNRNTATIPNHISLYDYFEKKVKEKFPDGKEGSERNRELVLRISEMWGAFVGNKIQKQTLKFFWLEECIDGGMYFERRFQNSMSERFLSGFTIFMSMLQFKFSGQTLEMNA